MGGKVFHNQLSPSSKNSKPTTLYFDPVRYQKVKVIAAIEQRSATDVIHEAIDMFLETREQTIKQVDKVKPRPILTS